MKKIKIILSLFIFPLIVLAQDSTRTKESVKQVITDKFPSSRFIDFEYEHLSPTSYTGKIKKEKFEKGKINSTHRAKLSLNYPVYKTSKFAITPLIRYRFETFNFRDIEKKTINDPEIYHRKEENFHYIMGAVNATYFSKLFGKYTIYSLNVSVDASNKGYEYTTTTLVGIMVLKKDARKTMTVGLAASFDKASLLPIFPIFSYEYKFGNSEWSFDTYIPKYLYFRRPLFTNGRLSLGTRLDNEHFYVHPESEKLKASYNIVRREIKTGFIYEHYIDKHFILTARGGFMNTMSWKITEKGSRKAIINYSPDMSMYLNLGFSYNL